MGSGQRPVEQGAGKFWALTMSIRVLETAPGLDPHQVSAERWEWQGPEGPEGLGSLPQPSWHLSEGLSQGRPGLPTGAWVRVGTSTLSLRPPAQSLAHGKRTMGPVSLSVPPVH